MRLQLVEVINEDYNDFVSLTTKLVNVDGVVLRMTVPLKEVGDKLSAVQAGLQSELNALNQGLQARQETAAARALLELMQDTAHTMTKVWLFDKPSSMRKTTVRGRDEISTSFCVDC